MPQKSSHTHPSQPSSNLIRLSDIFHSENSRLFVIEQTPRALFSQKLDLRKEPDLHLQSRREMLFMDCPVQRLGTSDSPHQSFQFVYLLFPRKRGMLWHGTDFYLPV